mmetsp:Transcript_13801/g.18432  ORF Transcript_13801/g.18432 Transcript_13801/m.18432 type:complete len:146 (+) Transcript_13801:51-488(+)
MRGLIILSYLSMTFAFMLPMRMAAPQLAKAKVSLKKDTVLAGPPQKAAGKTDAAKPKRKTVGDLEEVPMFKVFLLGDDDYDQEHICKSLCDIVEDMNIKQAEEIFQQAQNGGQALICVVCKEHAEHYVEQLLRREPMIFSELEED